MTNLGGNDQLLAKEERAVQEEAQKFGLRTPSAWVQTSVPPVIAVQLGPDLPLRVLVFSFIKRGLLTVPTS